MKLTRREMFRNLGAAVMAAPAVPVLIEAVGAIKTVEAAPAVPLAIHKSVEVAVSSVVPLALDVNQIMAGWVDRGPWRYWDTHRIVPEKYVVRQKFIVSAEVSS